MTSVLIVDDEPELRDVIGAGLGLVIQKLQVHEAVSGRDAMLKIQSLQLDLIICDVSMPNGSGHDVLTFLKESGSRIPIIIFTALTDKRCISSEYSGLRGIFDKRQFNQLLDSVEVFNGPSDDKLNLISTGTR